MKRMEREQTTIRLPKDLIDKLRAEADKDAISLNALIVRILNDDQNRTANLNCSDLKKI